MLANADDNWVNYFQVSSNIAQPVTIKTNLGTYSFSGSFTLRGHISRMEAFDHNGNRIVNTQPYEYERGTNVNKNWYRFSDIYESYSSSYDDDSNYGGDSLSGAAYSLGTALGSVLAYGLISGAEGAAEWGYGLAKLDVSGGLGYLYGGFGGQVSFRLPRIIGISGGLGKTVKNDGLNWSIGPQIWLTNMWNIGASYYKFQDFKGWGFTTGLEIHLFGPVGLKGDIGLCTDGNTDVIWDAGIMIRLFGND